MLKEGMLLEGKYRVIKKLGEGGTAKVYLVWHEAMGVYRAVKEIVMKDADPKNFARQNLLKEIYIMKKIKHPNLPVIYDVIIKRDVLWLIMEYIEGENLKDVLKREGYVDEKRALSWGRQICGVLGYLHGQNPPIIHRDLKPTNLILRKDGYIVLIDFGTAREYRSGERRNDTTCLGTRGYAAPEQYGGNGQTDERTDIYGLGVTLYHLLTGKNPEEPPYHIYPVRRWRKELSPGIEEVILKCVRENPEERYVDCRQLDKDLQQLAMGGDGFRKKEKKVFWCLLAGVFLPVLAAGWCLCKAERMQQMAAKTEVRRAERAQEEKSRRQFYKNALLLEPTGTYIYDSLLENYVRPNDFQPEDAAGLADVLGLSDEKRQSVLEIYRKYKPDEYCSFSYAVGIGYFFYWKTIEGKKDAYPWFKDILQVETRHFSREKRKRAALYADISSYYRTFVANGKDQSGERKTGDYAAFFHTLKELNQIKLHQNSAASEVAAAYLISWEVAVETGDFAAEFMREGGISAQMMQRELDIVYPEKRRQKDRAFWLEKRRDRKEMQDLQALVEEARKKIKMIEEEKEWDRGSNKNIT